MTRCRTIRAALLILLAAWSNAASAQTKDALPTIGLLAWANCDEDPDFIAGLEERGRVPGKTIRIVCRSAEGQTDNLVVAARDLVKLHVDIIATMSQPAGRAARMATETIPIVTIISGDPVAGGLAKSLARPGGNLTGVTYYATEPTGKRLELLKEMVTMLAVVGVLSNPDVSYLPFEADTLRAAETLGLRTVICHVRGPGEFVDAFQQVKAAGAQALFILPDVMIASNSRAIAEGALAFGLPAMGWGGWFTDAGVLMSYSADYVAMTRRLGFYIDRVLAGTPAGEIPIEQPTSFELSINARSARALGITVPLSLLARAGRVIE